MAGGRPLKFKDPEELWEAGFNYLQDREMQGRPVTITGLAIALDTSRETLMNYEKRDEFFDTVKRLKAYCEDYAEQSMFVGKNAAGPIFALKNYGWKDRTETDITTLGKELPTPILGGIAKNVPADNSDQENS